MPRPYSTVEDWKKICPEQTILRLTDDLGMGAIDTAKVSELIAAADGEIEPYLEAAGWSIPLATVPDLIRNFSATLGIYKGHQRKVAEVPKSWRQAYVDAISYLKDIRDGKMKLPTTTPADTVATFASGALITSHFE
jgi:phage gp36-like protein